MNRISETLAVAGIALPLVAVSACTQLSSVVSAAAADAPSVADAVQTICKDLVPAAEATANALAKGGAAATIQATENNYVAPACEAADAAAQAVDSGWLANLVATMISTAATSQTAAAPTPSNGGN
jgi:hypothetical protein